MGAKINSELLLLLPSLKTAMWLKLSHLKLAGGPSRDWLKLVRTSNARNKIKHWLKNLNVMKI